tara:strand:+ start:58 stop:1524 length:1467 start_codon:yes stop_codon:yes gene_type:complete
MTLEGTPDAAATLGATEGADIGTGEAPVSPPVPPEVPPAVPGEPDTQTMAGLVGDITGTSTLAEPRTSPFVHVLRDGQYNIPSLTAALADEGVARDQIDRLMGRATQYNASIKAMNEESRAYQIEESKIENANLFAQAVARHPDLGPELLSEAIAIYGIEGAEIYEGLMKGVKARQEIASGKTEGLQENIHSIATMLEFAVHPDMQQQLSRAMVQSIADAGQPVLPEMYDFTPDQWRDLADSYGGERPPSGETAESEDRDAYARSLGLESGRDLSHEEREDYKRLSAENVRAPQAPRVVQRSWFADPNTGDDIYLTDDQAIAMGADRSPTADMRNKKEGRRLVRASISAIEDLSRDIITKVGPAQRADAIKRGVGAVFGTDPEFRVYMDARKALAGNLAVAQQGSRPSDADILAVWLPLVPNAYTDTSASADLKWDLIYRMSNVAVADEAVDSVVKGGVLPEGQIITLQDGTRLIVTADGDAVPEGSR